MDSDPLDWKAFYEAFQKVQDGDTDEENAPLKRELAKGTRAKAKKAAEWLRKNSPADYEEVMVEKRRLRKQSQQSRVGTGFRKGSGMVGSSNGRERSESPSPFISSSEEDAARSATTATASAQNISTPKMRQVRGAFEPAIKIYSPEPRRKKRAGLKKSSALKNTETLSAPETPARTSSSPDPSPASSPRRSPRLAKKQQLEAAIKLPSQPEKTDIESTNHAPPWRKDHVPVEEVVVQPNVSFSTESEDALRNRPSFRPATRRSARERAAREANRGRQRQRPAEHPKEQRSFSQASTASISGEEEATSTSKDIVSNSSQRRVGAPSPTAQQSRRRASPRPVPNLRRQATGPAGADKAERVQGKLKRSATTALDDDEEAPPPKKRGRPKSVTKTEAKPKETTKAKGKGKGKEKGIAKKSDTLRGVVLYFIPPARLFKRPKEYAQEHGAEVVSQLLPSVTHIVLAEEDRPGAKERWRYEDAHRNLNYQDPPPGVALVNHIYIRDSIQEAGRPLALNPYYDYALPTSKLHQVIGHKEALDKKKAQREAEIAAVRAETANAEATVLQGDMPSSPVVPTPPGEVPDSQPSLLATGTLTDSQAMPPPDTPASPQIKPDRRRAPETPERAGPTLNLGPKEFPFEIVKKAKRQPMRGWMWAEKSETKRERRRREAEERGIQEKWDSPPDETPEKQNHRFSADELSSPEKTPVRPRNALDDAIEEASRIANSPPDLDGETDVEDSQEILQHKNARRQLEKAGPDSWQQTFACMHGGTDGTSNDGPNALVIEKLQEMADIYERTKEPWKGPAYRKAISALRRETIPITTEAQARQIPGIGPRLATKIEEIARTKNLRRLEDAKSDKSSLILQGFMQVYGAGPRVAQCWMAQGYKTLDDVRTNPNLTKNQQIGLEHYDDFLERIPRGEVEQHESFIASTLASITPELSVTVGGSYRRGAATCGDIDFLISSKTADMSDATLSMFIFNRLIPRLEDVGYIKCSLAMHSQEGAGSKWHGAASLPCAQNPAWRRVDFLMVPWREWGAALIYFTGNDVFNRSLRLLASRKGMRLNQHGLYRDVLRGPGRERVTEGTLLESRDEVRIFEILGVPYRPPQERNIG